MIVKSQKEFVDQVEMWIRAGVQAIHVVAGAQAAQAEHLIEQAYLRVRAPGGKNQLQIASPRTVTWDAVNGLKGKAADDGADTTKRLVEARVFTKAVEVVTSLTPSSDQMEVLGQDACVIFRDPHPFLRGDAASLSSFKEAVKGNRFWSQTVSKDLRYRRFVFLLTNSHDLTPELSGYVSTIELPLPVKEEIAPVLERLTASWPAAIRSEFAAGTKAHETVCQALTGLTAVDIENTLSEAVVRHRDAKVSPAQRLELVRATIERQKADVLRRTEALQYIPLEDVLKAPELCGYENLDKWVVSRLAAYSEQAETLKIDRPKGLAITGIPGSGKSVALKLIAKRLQKPLVMFDIASVFGSLVGESERKMREALAAVTAMQDCVLAVDEIDKALGGSHESTGDSGVTRRVLGKFLSWLADKDNNIFVVFTMNRIEQLPPELTRRGRLDEIFWVDLPNDGTRVAILRLHLARRGVDPDAYGQAEWDQLAQATDGFVGAELEDVVKAARLESLLSGSPKAVPTVDQLLAVARKVQPLSKTDDTGLDKIREFSKTRAVPVGEPHTVKVRNGKRGRGLEVGPTDPGHN